jgi:hypothetical protein
MVFTVWMTRNKFCSLTLILLSVKKKKSRGEGKDNIRSIIPAEKTSWNNVYKAQYLVLSILIIKSLSAGSLVRRYFYQSK